MPIPYAESVSRWSRFVCASFLLAIPPVVYASQAIGIQIPPPQTKVYLRSQRTNYFIGENVILDLAVQNIGGKVLTFDVGGDYRGSSRSQRFRVTGTDEQGHQLTDPNPNRDNLGGIGGHMPVKPGETAYFPFEPLRYVQIDAPGTYTIRAHHDLGWDESLDGPWPGDSEIKLTFTMPTDEQALDLAARFTEIKRIEYAMNERQPTTIELPPDPSICNRFSFAALNKLAAAGNLGAIGCIGMTETYAATESLINLITADVTRIPDAATRMLALRLPDPDFADSMAALRDNTPFRDPGNWRRKALSAATWRPDFGLRLYSAALVLLKDADAKRRDMGAFYLEAIGTGDQLSAVFDALAEPVRANRHAGDMAGFRLPTGSYLYFPRPPGVEPLFRAADAMVDRGAPAPTDLSRPAVLAFHIRRMRNRSEYRLPDWQVLAPSWVEHEQPFIRQLALEFLYAAPEPVPDSCVKFLAARLEDPDGFIRDAALYVIAKAKDPNSKAGVLRIVSSASGDRFAPAADAAIALGARFELVEICAQRLDENAMWYLAINRLIGLMDVPAYNLGGGLPGPADIQKAMKLWVAFLAKHRSEITAGKKFPLESFNTELFPAPTDLLIGNGEHWPVRK